MNMCKKTAIALSVLLLVSPVIAEEKKSSAKSGKHLVDMADGLNQQEFYEAKNPEAIWSSEGQAPWTRSEAVNAWEQGEPKSGKVVEDDMANIERPTAKPVMENGKPVEEGRLINVRVRYTLDPENSKASFSPVSAQTELYRQMGSHCGNGFQKISEWSEPVELADYYLYYQFRCMAPKTE
jgi:hypothetical protein